MGGLGDHDIIVHKGSVERLARRAPHGVLQRYSYDHWEPFKDQTPELIIKDQLDFLAKTTDHKGGGPGARPSHPRC
jgi:hypothetical protein